MMISIFQHAHAAVFLSNDIFVNFRHVEQQLAHDGGQRSKESAQTLRRGTSTKRGLDCTVEERQGARSHGRRAGRPRTHPRGRRAYSQRRSSSMVPVLGEKDLDHGEARTAHRRSKTEPDEEISQQALQIAMLARSLPVSSGTGPEGGTLLCGSGPCCAPSSSVDAGRWVGDGYHNAQPRPQSRA